jgi:hypothetical protein
MAVNKKLLLAITVISVLSFSAVAGVQRVNSEVAIFLPSPPLIAMPEEYINYTITSINGSLWAKIDGTYPLQILFGPDPLALVYPTPPGTTNVSVSMDDTELSWSNYTEIYPGILHHTAIGDWSMINCTIYPIPEYFTLKIHYEHPVTLMNGSYTFLYDLNISPYLSPWSTKSTAHFNIRMETNYTGLHLNTIATDEALNPINHTITRDDTAETITFQIVSEYSEPLLGDILITFTTPTTSGAVEFSYLLIILPLAVIATLIARIAYRRKHAGKRGSSNNLTEQACLSWHAEKILSKNGKLSETFQDENVLFLQF